MGTLPPTPTLGLVLPNPGTGEPWDTATMNGWFQTIDTAVDQDRDRLAAIEPLVLASGATPGVVPSGTTAERDTFWGTPGTAAARVALANKGARWWNEDKGYMQQYFAAYNDAGVTANTPVRNSAGWRPEQSLGLVPLRPASIANAGGSAVQKGTIVEFDGVTSLSLNQVFDSSAFQSYLVRVHAAAAAGTPDLRIRLRNGTTDAAGAGTYGWENLVSTGATIAASEVLNDTSWISGRLGTLSDMEITLHLRPPLTSYLSRGGDPGQQRYNSGYRASDATQYNGLTLFPTGSSMKGYLTVFGYNMLI